MEREETIPGDVLVEGAEKDHGDHAGQEENDDERVEDGEPLDVGVGHGLEDVVPAAAPLHLVLRVEGDRVAVRDRGVHVTVALDREGSLDRVRGARVRLLVQDRPGSDLDGHDAAALLGGAEVLAPVLAVTVVVVDHDVHVVEDVVAVRGAVVPADDAGVLGVALLVDVAAHGEAGGAVVLAVLHGVTPGHGHVVHDPVVLVVHEHALLQLRQLLLVLGHVLLVSLAADHLAGLLVLPKGDLVGRGPDPLAKDDLSEVLMGSVALVGLAEVEVVILVGDDRLLTVQSVHEELHLAGAGGGFLIDSVKWTINKSNK